MRQGESMYLTNAFCSEVKHKYGEAGEAWLAALPDTIDSCSERWALNNLKLTDNYSNAILFGTSDTYGDVVLKICMKSTPEIKAVRLLSSSALCKCCAADETMWAMLLERVRPGNDLTSVASEGDRVRIAAQLMLRLSGASVEADGFPTYFQWVETAIQGLCRAGNVHESMFHFVGLAEKFVQDIEMLGRSPKLLHGDLHHENILQSKDGQWIAIDPQGVAGAPFLECVRFIVNEVGQAQEHEKAGRIASLAHAFSDVFHESPRIIACGAFLDQLLILCAMYENNDEPDDILQTLVQCRMVLEFIESHTKE
ncbi:aminoglycoside phosphotransferase family protein [Paenibacillus silvisoli]|uniref:aminoglycoside phosphotransferase family protein n=1 Tax=Paenibacillus silvisoli TaxID=3110539 RepID=UPI0028062CB2|nr:aminoglycoside phosphotransferase family protein [Paenibacillus silvisoli]